MGIVVILLVLVSISFGYVMIKNPMGIGDMIQSYFNKEEIDLEKMEDYDHPLLNEEQEEQLINSGIDISQVPSEITPEQEKCVTDKVSPERIQEIINGAQPTPFEMMQVLPCL
jgi:hypothetical protein